MKKEYKIRVKFFYIKVFSRSHYRRVNPSRILLFHRPLPEGFLLPSGFISRPFTYYSTEGFPFDFGFYLLFLPHRFLEGFSLAFGICTLPFPTAQPKAFPCLRDFTSCLFTYYSTESFPLTSNFALFPFPLLNRKLSPLPSASPIYVSVYQKTQGSLLGFIGSRQRLSLPGRLHPSTFRAEELNFCVRDENRWFLFAIVTAIVLLRVSAVITFPA